MFLRNIGPSGEEGDSNLRIKCEQCHARYRFDETVLKGAKGALVRCRNCGKSILVLIPGESDSEVSVFHSVTSPQSRSAGDGSEPAVSSMKEDPYPSPDVRQRFFDEDTERAQEKKREGTESWAGITERLPPVSLTDQKPGVFFPPFPKSPPKARYRRLFRWPSIFSAIRSFLL